MYNIWLNIVILLNRLLRLFGLRKEQRYWGTVYDSVAKQPLDPAIVKLINAASGETEGECITDMTGKYSFLANTGRYKILVRKAHYAFPSQKVLGEKDGVFGNLYHGELFDLLGDSDVVNFNIPLDPLETDWNQQAKKQKIKFYPRTEIVFSVALTLMFWAVLLLALYRLVFVPSLMVKAVIMIYGAVFFLALFLPRPRLWGRIKSSKLSVVVSRGTVELVHRNIPSVAVARSKIMEQGKFFLRADKGSYLLRVILLAGTGRNPLIFTYPVKVKEEGVINRDIAI